MMHESFALIGWSWCLLKRDVYSLEIVWSEYLLALVFKSIGISLR